MSIRTGSHRCVICDFDNRTKCSLLTTTLYQTNRRWNSAVISLVTSHTKYTTIYFPIGTFHWSLFISYWLLFSGLTIGSIHIGLPNHVWRSYNSHMMFTRLQYALSKTTCLFHSRSRLQHTARGYLRIVECCQTPQAVYDSVMMKQLPTT